MINILRTKEIKKQIGENPNDVMKIINRIDDIGICITNSNGNYVTVNQKYCDIYGYTKGEFIGKSFTIVVPPEQREKLQNMHDKFIENEYEILRNWEVMRKDGKRIKISADAGFFNTIFNKTPHKVTFISDS